MSAISSELVTPISGKPLQWLHRPVLTFWRRAHNGRGARTSVAAETSVEHNKLLRSGSGLLHGCLCVTAHVSWRMKVSLQFSIALAAPLDAGSVHLLRLEHLFWPRNGYGLLVAGSKHSWAFTVAGSSLLQSHHCSHHR